MQVVCPQSASCVPCSTELLFDCKLSQLLAQRRSAPSPKSPSTASKRPPACAPGCATSSLRSHMASTPMPTMALKASRQRHTCHASTSPVPAYWAPSGCGSCACRRTAARCGCHCRTGNAEVLSRLAQFASQASLRAVHCTCEYFISCSHTHTTHMLLSMRNHT